MFENDEFVVFEPWAPRSPFETWIVPKHHSSTLPPGGPERVRPLGEVLHATLVALYRTNELPHHVKRALDNGVTRDELIELITHLAFYAGWPNAFSKRGGSPSKASRTAEKLCQPWNGEGSISS